MTTLPSTQTWMLSPSGRLLHRIDQQGKSTCGRQFDLATLRVPEASSNSPTLPYCARCMKTAQEN
jgi:hypothetical protein